MKPIPYVHKLNAQWNEEWWKNGMLQPRRTLRFELRGEPFDQKIEFVVILRTARLIKMVTSTVVIYISHILCII